MKEFKDLQDGEIFVMPGGFILQKVSESHDHTAVFVEDITIGVRIRDNDLTVTVDEFEALPYEIQSTDFESLP